jgi:hypothetical protein
MSVDVDVDLDDFSEKQLLQGLVDAKWITEQEAEAIEKRQSTKQGGGILANPIDDELEEASSQLRRGNRSEALIHLERFLGRDWIGALQ